MYSEIPDKLRDMAQCIYATKDIDDIVSAFAQAQESLRYIWKDEGLVFMAPEFFVDIMVRPLSQFHIQLTEAYKTFSEALRHIPVENLYLEATSPSYLSQYAQYWVAEKLGMIHFNSNIVVV